MSELTAEERKWVKQVQKVLDKCPSKRIGFYTIGDNNVMLWDMEKSDQVYDELGDFCQAVNKSDADFEEDLIFPNQVASTAG